MPPQPLAVGVLCDQRLELRHQLGVAAKRQLRLDQLLERRQPQLLQPGDLALGKPFVSQIVERPTAPQRERLLQRGGGVLRVAHRQLVASSPMSRSKRSESTASLSIASS